MKILKRIILFLAIIISVLWIEAVYADMSAPEMRNFEVVVTNPDGVDYYDYNSKTVKGHLDKDDIVLVEYEYNNEYMISSPEKNSYGSHDTLGYVKGLADFSIVQEEVDPTKITNDTSIQEHDVPQKAIVNAAEGVDIYAGPSTVYKKVGHIKNGTKLIYKYSSYRSHIYVEYDGVKGWIEILKGKVLIPNDTQYIFRKDVVTECGTVPRNSITTPAYKTDAWTHKALFEYNGCEFMHNTMKDDEIYIIYPINRVLNKDVNLYEYADKSSTVLTTIPAGEEVVVLASGEYYGEQSILYVEYNDFRGWVVEYGNVIVYGIDVTEPDDMKVEDTIKIEDPIKVDEDIAPMVTEKMGITTFILLCAFGVSLLVITALVIIILVNRSKAAKKEEVKTTVENNEEK